MSDQPKLLRLVQLIQILACPVYHTIDEIATQMNLSSRTIRRYFDTLAEAGYVIQERGNRYHILSTKFDPDADLSDAIIFSPVEAQILSSLIASLSSDVAVRHNLQSKVAAVSRDIPLVRIVGSYGPALAVEELRHAIRHAYCVTLLGYASANSATISDRLVEPVAFSENYTYLYAFDLKRKAMRTFRLTRLQGVKAHPDQPWSHRPQHHKPLVDAFHMAGTNPFPVTLHLTLRAYDLLVEEYPLAAPSCKPLQDHAPFTHICHLQCRRLEGVGRFVLGLPGEIRIVNTPSLTQYLQEKLLLHQTALTESSKHANTNSNSKRKH